MLLKLVETLKINWRTTAVDTSVKNTIPNVDTLSTTVGNNWDCSCARSSYKHYCENEH